MSGEVVQIGRYIVLNEETMITVFDSHTEKDIVLPSSDLYFLYNSPEEVSEIWLHSQFNRKRPRTKTSEEPTDPPAKRQRREL